MNEHEARELLENGPGFPPASRVERAERISRFGYCRNCFQGDRIDPPAMCGECEDDAIAADEAEEFARHEEELDAAFHEMCDELDQIAAGPHAPLGGASLVGGEGE